MSKPRIFWVPLIEPWINCFGGYYWQCSDDYCDGRGSTPYAAYVAWEIEKMNLGHRWMPASIIAKFKRKALSAFALRYPDDFYIKD